MAQEKRSAYRALLRRAAGYGLPYRRLIGVMFVSIVVSAFLGVLPPLLIRQVVDVALPGRDLGLLNWLVLGMIALSLTTGGLGMLQNYLNARIGEGVTYDLRRALYTHMQRMSLRFFTSKRTGELMSRLSGDVYGARRALTNTLFDLCSNVISLGVILAVIISLEWRLTLLALLTIPPFLLLGRGVGGRLSAVVRRQMVVGGEISTQMQETLNVSGALLVRILGRREYEEGRYGGLARELHDLGIRQATIVRAFNFGLNFFSALGLAAIVWLGGYLIVNGTAFTVGTLVAFIVYLSQLYGPVRALNNTRVDLASAMVSFERVFEVLDIPLEITEKPHAVALPQVEGRIAFENVSFSYNAGDPVGSADAAAEGEQREPAPLYALRDVSFSVQPGQFVALVGPSGAGKTTITYLLPRLYDPTAGRISVDNVDIRDLTFATLTDNIGMVPQETYLFHDTVRANLLYARPDATAEALEAACRAANIHDVIAALPQGYETIVGERGYRLSGGEKQRVAIARLLLKNPRILILDEATSSLDSTSEALIQSALERLMAGRTSLVIAHRLSTVLSADLILVLEQGRLAEQGTHAELLAANGLYADLYRTQYRHLLEQEQTGLAAESSDFTDIFQSEELTI